MQFSAGERQAHTIRNISIYTTYSVPQTTGTHDTKYRLDAESNGSTQCRNLRGPRMSVSRAKRGRY